MVATPPGAPVCYEAGLIGNNPSGSLFPGASRHEPAILERGCTGAVSLPSTHGAETSGPWAAGILAEERAGGGLPAAHKPLIHLGHRTLWRRVADTLLASRKTA